MADQLAEIVVVNERASLVYPQGGSFAVAVVGRWVGMAPHGGELRRAVSPGTHTVRIQQWHFYRSPRVTVETVQGKSSVLRADKPAGPVWKAVVRLIFRPFSSLRLELAQSDVGQSGPGADVDESAIRGRQRAFQIYAVSMVLAFIAIIVALKLIG